MEATKYNGWAERFLWSLKMPASCPARDFPADSEELVDWVRALQTEHGLLVDGRIGPSTLYVCIALWGESGGSVGGLSIGGVSVDIGVPVVRFFGPGSAPRLAEPPRLGVLLSQGNLEYEVAKRSRGERPARAHFTIESGRGSDGRSMVLQWADPLAEVPFAPVDATDGDYPPQLHAVGVELENPLVVHERRHDERLRLRTRVDVRAEVCGRTGRQLAYFPEQLATLDLLIGALAERVEIPRAFPRTDAGLWATSPSETPWDAWRGWLGRFNWFDRLGEPGNGLATHLGVLFGDGPEDGLPAAESRRPPPPRRASSPGSAPASPPSRAPSRAPAPEPLDAADKRPPAWMVDQGWVIQAADGAWAFSDDAPESVRRRHPFPKRVAGKAPDGAAQRSAPGPGNFHRASPQSAAPSRDAGPGAAGPSSASAPPSASEPSSEPRGFGPLPESDDSAAAPARAGVVATRVSQGPDGAVAVEVAEVGRQTAPRTAEPAESSAEIWAGEATSAVLPPPPVETVFQMPRTLTRRRRRSSGRNRADAMRRRFLRYTPEDNGES